MPTKPKNSTAGRIDAARILINNTLAEAEIKAAVAEQGYDDAELESGAALLNAAQEAMKDKTFIAGDRNRATDTLKADFNAAKKAYQTLSKILRVRFKKSPAVLDKIGLKGRMPKGTGPFIAAALTLFDNAAKDTEVMASLAKRKFTAAKLKAGRDKIEALAVADQQQESAKGDSRQGTGDKQKAVAALDEWVSEYRLNARLALENKPELLAKIGIPVRRRKASTRRTGESTPPTADASVASPPTPTSPPAT